ncbi:ATP dependent RNA helicase [Zostera marina]|uniref:ATP-dependent RNA helicase n=1 Tax=Zostera marina TaxID=29655 RepID=A0A0K9P7W9_ZOSMR|nr:ATP dependent RNA helicase [Zostera marina]
MGVRPKKILLSAAKCKLVEESKEDNSKLKTNGGSSLFASCSFEDLGLHPTLCQHLQDKMGFQGPTTIQAQAIPVALSGRHLLVNAATGTGKTVVYLAPIVHLLQMRSPKIERSDGTIALVLVPTRELCMQVYEILQKLVHRFHWIVPGYIMGGENRSKEKARLRKGISVLVATPGRLLDHLQKTTSFKYNNLQWIVFDEADSILEHGFGKAIEEILDFLDSRKSGKDMNGQINKFPRQNMLLSATLNEKVNHLANISLENPVMVGLDSKIPCVLPASSSRQIDTEKVDKKDEPIKLNLLPNRSTEDYNLPEQLIQRCAKVSCDLRLVMLVSIIKALFERDASQKIVVFFSTCDSVDFHYSLLSQFCWSPDSRVEEKEKKTFVGCKSFRLHGNMEHIDRRTTFQEFNSEKSALLLCTDVAARGLDIPRVRCIIQYDSPGEATEYVHRVGRTARLGEKGEAILFLQPIEIDYLHNLQKHNVSLEDYPLQKIIDNFPLHGQRQRYRTFLSLETHPWVLTLQKALEIFISKETETQKLAKEAFCSWVRAYTAHRGDLKRIFMVKKLHLGHVARSFGLKDQPSLVGRSFKVQEKKRKKYKKLGPSKRQRVAEKT